MNVPFFSVLPREFHYLRPPSIPPPRGLLETGRTRGPLAPPRYPASTEHVPRTRPGEAKYIPPDLKSDTLPSGDRPRGEWNDSQKKKDKKEKRVS